jgi:hypothetical protein
VPRGTRFSLSKDVIRFSGLFHLTINQRPPLEGEQTNAAALAA